MARRRLHPDRMPTLPPMLALWVPVALVVAYPAARALAPEFHASYIYGEDAAVETLTVLAGLAAAGAAFAVFLARRRLPRRWLGFLFLLLAAACIFLAGEEASWGQRLFGWETPETVAAVNKQQETNLHNMTEALDRYLRLLGGLGALIGGVAVPLIERRTGSVPFGQWPWAAWIWPTRDLIPAGMIVALPRVIERIEVWTGRWLPAPFDMRSHEFQEFQEMAIALFLFFFALSVWLRLRRAG